MLSETVLGLIYLILYSAYIPQTPRKAQIMPLLLSKCILIYFSGSMLLSKIAVNRNYSLSATESLCKSIIATIPSVYLRWASNQGRQIVAVQNHPLQPFNNTSLNGQNNRKWNSTADKGLHVKAKIVRKTELGRVFKFFREIDIIPGLILKSLYYFQLAN